MWQKIKSGLARRLPAIGHDNQPGRDTWVARTLRDLPAGFRVLDAGAGTQPYRKYCDHLRYVSQDFAAYDGRGDSTGQQTGSFEYGPLDHICDIVAIPEADGSFDAILCTEVLEHVPDPLAALRELARLLRPGGRLILTSPFTSATHFAPYHYCTGFSRYFYDYHLPRCSLRILDMTPNGNFYSYLAQELRRLPIIAGAYGKQRLGIATKVSLALLLHALAGLQRRDSRSHEFLCYGYHVLAEKSANSGFR